MYARCTSLYCYALMFGAMVVLSMALASGVGNEQGSWPPKVIEDATLKAAVDKARARYLATRPVENPVTRCDVTVMIPDDANHTTWRRGSHNPTAISYPASCVKMAYMVAACAYAREHGLPTTYLETHVRPMIVYSDNLETGVVVDFVTGCPNQMLTDPKSAAFKEFLHCRNSTERLLDTYGLLGNQRILHKTYPSNSGPGPVGAEHLAYDATGGSNRMGPELTAMMVLGIIEGYVEPTCTEYFQGLLGSRKRWNEMCSLGFGLPPGTKIYNKGGAAYVDLNGIAYLILPNGQTLVTSVFTDSWERDKQPYPYNFSHLGPFADFLLDALNDAIGILEGAPPKLVYSSSSDTFTTAGSGWSQCTSRPDKYGPTYACWAPSESTASPTGSGRGSGRTVQAQAQAQAGEDEDVYAQWTIDLPSEGLWELAIWNPQDQSFTAGAHYDVTIDGETNTYVTTQQLQGGRWVRLDDLLIASAASRRVTIRVSLGGTGHVSPKPFERHGSGREDGLEGGADPRMAVGAESGPVVAGLGGPVRARRSGLYPHRTMRVAADTGMKFVADAIKFTQWPSCKESIVGHEQGQGLTPDRHGHTQRVNGAHLSDREQDEGKTVVIPATVCPNVY